VDEGSDVLNVINGIALLVLGIFVATQVSWVCEQLLDNRARPSIDHLVYSVGAREATQHVVLDKPVEHVQH
jgi:hypothetical protein